MGYRMDIVKLKSKNFHATPILDGLVDPLLSKNETIVMVAALTAPVRQRHL